MIPRWHGGDIPGPGLSDSRGDSHLAGQGPYTFDQLPVLMVHHGNEMAMTEPPPASKGA